MYQLKVAKNTKSVTSSPFFSIYNINTTVELLFKQGLINNAKFELDDFLKNFELKDDVTETVTDKYQQLLAIKQKTWYQNATTIAPDVTQLAQPAIQYFNNLAH